MLRIEGIQVYYGDLQALHGVSLGVQEAQLVAIVGANGAGKSTLLMTISGILRPREGSISFMGERLSGLAPHRVVDMGIVQVPEGRQLFPSMTVRDNLDMGSNLSRAREKRAQTLEWVYTLFPILKEREKQPAGTLSGGEQQMLAIGRGLMALPRLLLLDEPSLGLAPLLVAEIFNIVKEINRGGTSIILVEQNVFHALKMSHRAYILENGRIVLAGSGEELLSHEHTKRAYLGL